MHDRLGKLQEDLLGQRSGLGLPSTSKTLFDEIRGMLLKARKNDLLATSQDEVHRIVKCFSSHNDPQLHGQLRRSNLHEHAFCIVGGNKNFHRNEALPHLRRSDGAWFDFSITVREVGGVVELLAYNFEIRLPSCHGVPFLRFDLNPPGHDNEARELRCHLHAGHDDLQIPAPLMSPREVLTLFLEGLRADRGRTRSEFEHRWYQATIDKVPLAR